VNKVKLQADLKFDMNNKGIKRSEQPKATLVNNFASYAETILKLIVSKEVHNVDDIMPQLRYLQQEKSLLLVNSSLGEGVGKLYRQFRENTSMITSGELRTMESCVTLHNAVNTSPAAGRGSGNFSNRCVFFCV
jgi:hypothetical protein